jgi:hypothetical protein
VPGWARLATGAWCRELCSLRLDRCRGVRVTLAFRGVGSAGLVSCAMVRSGFLREADPVSADASEVWWVLWPNRRLGAATAAATAARPRTRAAARRRAGWPGRDVVAPRKEMVGPASAAAPGGRRPSCDHGSLTSAASPSCTGSRSSSPGQESSSPRPISGPRGAACGSRARLLPLFRASGWVGRSLGCSLPLSSARRRRLARPSARAKRRSVVGEGAAYVYRQSRTAGSSSCAGADWSGGVMTRGAPLVMCPLKRSFSYQSSAVVFEPSWSPECRLRTVASGGSFPRSSPPMSLPIDIQIR